MALRGRAAALNLPDDDVRGQWAACFRTLGGTVVLDCLRPVMDASGLDENHDAGRFLEAFDALLVDAGIPEALVVHHMGHTADALAVISRACGTGPMSSGGSCARTMRSLSSPRTSPPSGATSTSPKVPARLQPSPAGLTIAGGSRAVTRKTAAALAAVLDVLRRQARSAIGSCHPRLRPSPAVEHPRDTVRAAIRKGVRRWLS